MKAIWLTLFAFALSVPPAIAYASHRGAVTEQRKLEQSLTQTRSKVQRVIDLRSNAPAIHQAIYDDTSLVTTVRAGLRAAGVPDASVRDISTRRRPTLDSDSTEAGSIDVTMNPCSPHLLGLVISFLVSDASESETAIFALRSVSMTRPSGSRPGNTDFQVTITFTPSISREISPS